MEVDANAKKRALEAPQADDAQNPMTKMMGMLGMLEQYLPSLKKLDKLDTIEVHIREVNERIEKIESVLSKHEQDIKSLQHLLSEARKEAAEAKQIASTSPKPQSVFRGAPVQASSHRVLPPFSERMTLVIGGFKDETLHSHIEKELVQLKNKIKGVASYWAPAKRGSIGKLTFDSPSEMWEYIKTMKGKRIEVDDLQLWFTVEKSKEEMDVSKRVSKAVRLVRDILTKTTHDPSDKDNLDADWNRGKVWVLGHRVVSKDPASGLLKVNTEAVEKTGLELGGAQLQAALDE